MSDNPYISLIQGLNTDDSPVNATASSPEDYAAELSLWTNAEFTFDMPPGFGIFENDSGFEQLAGSNSLLRNDRDDPVLGQQTNDLPPPPPSTPQLDQQSLPFLDLSSQDSRPLSLLERTRQRNPLTEEPRPELQEQVAAINSFQSLLAAYSAAAAASSQIQQQLQHVQPPQQKQVSPSSFTAIQPAIAPAPALTSTSTPMVAPVTPAAAKVLRQPMPQYNKAELAKKSKSLKVTTTVPSIAPSPASAIDTLTAVEKTVSTQRGKSKAKAKETPVVEKQQQDEEDEDEDEDEEESKEISLSSSSSGDSKNVVGEVLAKAAAEEDKRRRNTAASARFRQKKKLREQALEQTVREQTARAESLEARIRELEMEARWLRGLIVEKDSRLLEVTANLEDTNKRIRLE